MKGTEAHNEELQWVKERIQQIAPEREKIKERLETAKKKHSQVESRIAEIRKERQSVLVDEGNLEDVNARLKEVRKSDELLEDEIEGLSRKLSDLDKEEQDLTAKLTALRKKIFKEETVIPLVAKYNKLAPELAEILAKLDEAIDVYIKTFNSQGNKLIRSNKDNYGILSLPAIWMYEEEPIPEYYNRIATAERIQGKNNERHVMDSYPACKCFGCAEYAGVLFDLTVRCKRLAGQVPQEILLGQNAQRKTPETERCSFTPRKE